MWQYKYRHMSSDRMYKNAAATECYLDYFFVQTQVLQQEEKMCLHMYILYLFFILYSAQYKIDWLKASQF